MTLNNFLIFVLFLSAGSADSRTVLPKHGSNIPSAVTNSSFSFGQHYAVLNLDMINGLVSNVNNTEAGNKWISNTANWINE